MKGPIPFSEASEAVTWLYQMMSDYGTVLDESNRTSVHIHLNVQAFNFNRLAAFAALFFTFEELLAEWSGEHRVGNLFCLRAKDAPGIVSRLRKYIENDGCNEIADGIHYAGMNFQAIQKFGSVEIRYLRGVTDPKIILDWIGMLQRIYEMSATFPDPRDVCSAFSYTGASGFIDEILGSWGPTLLNGIEMNQEQVRDSLYEGIRFAQDLCFCRDWSLYEPIPLVTDPFGRNVAKKVKKSSFSDMFLTTPPLNANSMTHQEYSDALSGLSGSSDTPTPAPDYNVFPPYISIPDPVVITEDDEDDDYEPEEDYDEEVYEEEIE